MTDTDREKTMMRALDIILSLVLTIALGLTSWNLKQTIEHGQVLAEIRANRFTTEDGLQIWHEIADIREEMATLPKEVPPQWFLNEVSDLKDAVARIETRVNSIERTLDRDP